jgi:hypothetical protein
MPKRKVVEDESDDASDAAKEIVLADDAMARQDAEEAADAADLDASVDSHHSLAKKIKRDFSMLREIVRDFERERRTKFALAGALEGDFLDALNALEEKLQPYVTFKDPDVDASTRTAARGVVMELCLDSRDRYNAGDHGLGRCNDCRASITGAQCNCGL